MNFPRLFATVRYLKPQQIFYRCFYVARKKLRPVLFKHFDQSKCKTAPSSLKLQKSIDFPDSYLGGNKFVFLNIEHDFGEKIDWNHPDYGKLWTYNLNYFEFLNQKNISKEAGIALINNFVSRQTELSDGMEPYPVSLRTVNWIKFFIKHDITDEKLHAFLYFQYQCLMKNLEYHLFGNHLLENAFSLLFGAYFFQDENFYKTAKKLLTKELDEQILPDGADFELSTMYHQIILFRVLDTINLVKNNPWKNGEILDFLTKKAEIMLGWLSLMTFSDGTIPLFNDSAVDIAPTSQELFDYAGSLEIKTVEKPLKKSGYRKFTGKNYEIFVDAGKIGPDYIPGHAHADMLNFELHLSGKPCVVDTGTTTYQRCPRRSLERSTAAHNTVSVNNQNQSDVWGGFRVGKRAEIKIENENDNQITASHNGFGKVIHSREFVCEENRITIRDTLTPSGKGKARIHFHPSVEFSIENNTLRAGNFTVSFKNIDNIETEKFEYSLGFNKTSESKCIVVNFTNKTETVFEL